MLSSDYAQFFGIPLSALGAHVPSQILAAPVPAFVSTLKHPASAKAREGYFPFICAILGLAVMKKLVKHLWKPIIS